jgi:GT2 family glycosyltransferase
MTPSLSIIIVNFNAGHHLMNCLESVFSSNYPEEFEVIVVDNNSSDDSIDAINDGFSDVKLIKNTSNLGFAKACNQGLESAVNNYVLFLNPDTIVRHDALVKSVDFIDSNPDIGLIGCRLLSKNGSLQSSCADFPYLRTIVLDHLFRWWKLSNAVRAKMLLKYWTHDEIREVDWMLGAFLMTRRSVLTAIGGFDEAFFLYGEDLDLCFRIKQAGWKVVFFPDAQIIHIGNSVWDSDRRDRVYQALVGFHRKHFGFFNAMILKGIISIAQKRHKI